MLGVWLRFDGVLSGVAAFSGWFGEAIQTSALGPSASHEPLSPKKGHKSKGAESEP